MSLWRYRATSLHTGVLTRGELAGASAAEVRAALRNSGLRPVEVRPLRAKPLAIIRAAGPVFSSHLRRRRTEQRAEFYDGLATMLGAGVSLHEALSTIARSARRHEGRAMRLELAEAVREGRSLADAMGDHASWYDAAECAMVRAGQARGELGSVLRSLSDRHQQSGELAGKLIGALAYPALVACLGVGVATFLSVKTLPELVGVLEEADVVVPRLTELVMTAGQWLFRHVLLLGVGAVVLCIFCGVLPTLAQRIGIGTARLSRFVPGVFRRMALASALQCLADLVRTGVPLVDALRVVAPTARGLAAGGLGTVLQEGASKLEQGQRITDVFCDPVWFTDEHRRLLTIGETTGELEAVLERIATREGRKARRKVDRLARLLEPAAVLALAAVVGLVVLAAVLPLVRLQEIF